MDRDSLSLRETASETLKETFETSSEMASFILAQRFRSVLKLGLQLTLDFLEQEIWDWKRL